MEKRQPFQCQLSALIAPFLGVVIAILLLLPNQASASHVLGGDITYQHLQGDSFLVKVTLYRDCNGITLAPPTLYINGSATNVGFSSAPLVDITPVCGPINSRCISSSTTFPFGVEKAVYTAVVDLSSYSACSIDLQLDICCRSGNYSTGLANQNFFLETTLNKCSTSNKSPYFMSDPFLLSCVGECIETSLAAFDPDGDSLVYSIADPMSDPNTLAQWSPPFSSTRPVSFSGFPNDTLPFSYPSCRGFHLDSSNGLIQFRPILQEMTSITYKVEEYRNGVKIGEILREVALIVTSCSSGGNVPILEESTTPTDVIACVGSELEMFVVGQIDTTDSIAFTHATNAAGATFSRSGDTVFFNWTPTMADFQPEPYFLSLAASSTSCDVVGRSHRLYSISVQDKAAAARHSIIDLGCNTFQLKLDSFSKQAEITWNIEGVSLPNPHDTSITHTFLQGGTYPVSLVVEESCSAYYFDTIHVDPIFSIELPAQDTACLGSAVTLTPLVLNGPADSFRWSTGDTGRSIQYMLTHDTLVSVTGFQNGCSWTDSIRLTTILPPVVDLGKDVTLCPASGARLVARAPDSSGSYGPHTYMWSGPNGSINQNNDTIWGSSLGLYHVTASNNFGCTGEDSTVVTPFIRVDAGADLTFCINAGSIFLSGSPQGGTWSGNGLIGRSNNIFNPARAGAGTHTLVYAYADSSTTCTGMDSMTITVLPPPSATIPGDTAVCPSSAPLLLSATPQGGIWSGPGITGATFDPTGLSSGTYQLIYSHYDSLTNCTGVDTFNVEILPLSSFSIPATDSICLGDTATLIVTGTGPFTWTPSASLSADTGKTVLTFPTQTTTYTVTTTGSSSCVATNEVTVHVLDDCVWPGDANSDGVVNNLDLLPIGLFFGETGPQRPNASLQWTAQVAPDWDTATSSYNLKHVDTDGDSTITSLDTVAVSLNYSLTHPRGGGSRSPVSLWLKGPEHLKPGDTAILELFLGDEDWRALDAYGVAFSIQYPEQDVVLEHLQFEGDLGMPAELLSLQKWFGAQGKIEAAISRTDGLPRSGILKLGELMVVAASGLAEGHQLPLAVEDVTMVDAAGQMYSLQGSTTTVEISMQASLTHEPTFQVELSPNPADQELLIRTDIDLQRVTMLDMLGKQVPVQVTVNGHLATLATHHLKPGMYLVQIETKQGMIVTRKVLIQ